MILAVSRFRVANGLEDEVQEAFRQRPRFVDDELGLGLAIARQIVELHGGTIDADSHGPASGATFTVSLPPAEG